MKQAKNASRAFINNRKRTKGRTIQLVPIFDKPKSGDEMFDEKRKVVDTRKIAHRQKINTTK